jgi:hypothetical protein
MTIAQIKARPEVWDVVICPTTPRGDCYKVLIYLETGYRAEDRTSTLYGATVREAAKGLKFVEVGDPE